MKNLVMLSLLIFPFTQTLARDPGVGSNTTFDSAGPANSGAAPSSTSIMGGGTPGSDASSSLNVNEPTDKELEQIRQEQEEREARLEEENSSED